MGFKEIVPGVLANMDRAKVSQPRPDPCIILEVEFGEKWAPLGDMKIQAIYVFSSLEVAQLFATYISSKGNIIAVTISWDELVNRFGGYIKKVFVDPRPSTGYAQVVPLKKNFYLTFSLVILNLWPS